MRRLLLLVIGIVAMGGSAFAHDEAVSTSDVQIEGDEIVWKVDVGLAGLGKVLRLPPPDQLDSAAPAIGTFLAGGLELHADGRPLVAQLGELTRVHEPEGPGGAPVIGRVVQTLRYRATAPITQVRAGVTFFASITQQHRAVVRVRWGEQMRQFVRLGPTELTLAHTDLTSSSWRTGWEFFRWGIDHIVVGYDHVLFLLALLLVVTRLRDLITIVTSFTIAHSVTLLLSAWQIVTIPSRLTEVLIAASIVYVAAENLLRGARSARRRALLTFLFGLVHGLGFATELRARLDELSGSVVGPVLAFNLGVECGQLALVAITFPLLAWLRRAPSAPAAARRQGRIVVIGSVPILLAGLFWVIDRLSG